MSRPAGGPDGGPLRWHVQPATAGAEDDLDWAMRALARFRARAAQDGVDGPAAAGGHGAAATASEGTSADVASSDLVRVYVPEPSVAFGQRDARLPGFEAARAAALEHGFVPLVRRAGGRAAAYHHGCVVVDHLAFEPDAALRQQARFEEFAHLFVRAFARMGVPASVGEIPGEYCPGEFSVQGPAPAWPVKLAGSAQRVVKGAWLLSTHVVVSDPAPLREVLTHVYRDLGLEMDPRTVGAAEDVVPGASVPAFIRALRQEYADWAAARGRELVDVPDPGPTP